ncbi:DUF4251 domain-containing protein [Hyunsoonleella flava]|uniref:DUF4251 domain-containing protein n=1 Tax=Hyunsoonleella flava TaxID=2527939 RepID=A0A4Q9FLP6_9FLAO|nr:DUF4251 domain-containing protein [Hyunsoonleella flava]TBN06610.1 DUF4251 domain-containing protein [Hyunsoonleella flava]
MKRYGLVIFILVGLIISCKSSKVQLSPEEEKQFRDLVASQEFTVESDWAYPQLTNAMTQVLNSMLMWPNNNGGAINLIGNANFLTIKGDSVTSYLPYFGERQMQVGYGGTDSAIEFNGVMEDFKVEEGKNNRKIISFSAKSNAENFNVIITLFPNLNSEIYLRSPSRFFIRYTGNFGPITKTKDDQS